MVTSHMAMVQHGCSSQHCELNHRLYFNFSFPVAFSCYVSLVSFNVDSSLIFPYLFYFSFTYLAALHGLCNQSSATSPCGSAESYSEDCQGIPSVSFFKRVLVWVFCWHPTPVFLLGKFRGKRSLAGYSPWGHKESDTTGHRTHIRYFVECPSICLVIRLQFQILGKNTTEVMCPAHGLRLGAT